MPRSKLPKATEEEVVAALAQVNRSGNVKMRSALTIAGVVAHERGCPDNWPDRYAIMDYVSISSVKAMLEYLVAEGKAYAVPGNHWSVLGKVSARYTYYLNEAGKCAAIEAQALRETRQRVTERETWTNQKLRKRFAMILDELNEEWERDNPPTDWAAEW